MTNPSKYALCIDDCGSPASLEVRKVYRVLADAAGSARGLVRVVDDSVEDYLYPASAFVPIEVPRAAAKVFASETA